MSNENNNMEEEQINKIRRIIQSNTLAVLSTVTPEWISESAVVEISVLNDLILIFDTLASFRKYRNLITNRSVSVVVGLEPATIQYEGVASELKEENSIGIRKFILTDFLKLQNLKSSVLNFSR